MPVINRLDKVTSERISGGKVIFDLHSAIKELIENSIVKCNLF